MFIGKNLDHEELKAGFMECMVTPESKAKKLKNLRFAVGDVVECNTEKGWDRGKVVALLYREQSMPPGMVAPYQVKLDRGPMIYAPFDEDMVVRKAK